MFRNIMGDIKSKNQTTKHNVKLEAIIHRPLGVTESCPPITLNGYVYDDLEESRQRSTTNAKRLENDNSRGMVHKHNSRNASPNINEGRNVSDDGAFGRLFSHGRCQPTNEAMDGREESPRIRNYQIRSVKKGVPVIDSQDKTVQRIRMKAKDLRISQYWICQRKKTETKKNVIAWIFSAFVTFVCFVCPLTSFASDVAFYVTCSDHYNHTAGILQQVKAKYSDGVPIQLNKPKAIFKDEVNVKTNDLHHETIGALEVKSQATPSNEIRPAPLVSRRKRSTDFLKALPNSNGRSTEKEDRHQLLHRSIAKRVTESVTSRRVPREILPIQANGDFRVTNFEAETREYNESACDPAKEVIEYMLTDQAAVELEAHRHVTIDIFEPVFILGSFPSLVLCILTRLVVLITGHRNFLSAYVINMACMPLQLITGALSVHSASYHLGKKGFECWHCAQENNCSDMDALWWLHDGVTKTLIVSIATKILDGVAGGLVLFIVIIRLLWSRGGHATFWWNMLRGFVIFAAFVFCVTVSPILVITPALGVMRLEFMELATPFPGLKGITFAMMALMGFGIATWCLSFAMLFVYLSYSMYMYCRERTIDH